MIYQVIVDISNSQVDRVFDYTGEGISVGSRVCVPFGNRLIEGFVVGQKETTDVPISKLKAIKRPLDDFVALSEQILGLCSFVCKKYHLRLVDALRLAIPSEMRANRIAPLVKRKARLSDLLTEEEIFSRIKQNAKTQRALAEFLLKEGDTNTEVLSKRFGYAALKSLREKGIVETYDVTVKRKPYKAVSDTVTNHILTDEQTAAVNAILDPVPAEFLLWGVTGSGKTEVYMSVIQRVVESGKTAIMLVPEISLTPNVLKLFRGRFGDTVAILHSGLSAGERYDEWLRLKRGEAKIAIGARSAVFAPLENIGIIIIDEEHDSSYQSDNNPRYDTRDVAQYRCRQNGCSLVLGSATPSLESFYKAQNKEYKLLTLSRRINKMPLPDVSIVDMTEETRAGNNDIFSRELVEELTRVVNEGNQAILFLNRRGYSSFVMCNKCGYVAKCPDCDVSLTYHKEDNLLKCHYCGRQFRVFDNCPKCKSPYIRQGRVGDQQVEARLKQLFPDVKVLRMDADTTQTKDGLLKILDAFGKREAQILVGTQMLAKGHDFPYVTLVGILNGDQSLHYDNYLAAEKTFQLLTQVAGRSGRDKRQGKVILQTYTPRHYCLQYAARQDYLGFYKREINLREASEFPPFSVVARVMYTGEESQRCIDLLNRHYADIEKLQNTYPDGFLFLQKMRCPLRRLQGKHRFEILMRLSNACAEEILETIYKIVDKDTEDKVLVFTEVNPQNLT